MESVLAWQLQRGMPCPLSLGLASSGRPSTDAGGAEVFSLCLPLLFSPFLPASSSSSPSSSSLSPSSSSSSSSHLQLLSYTKKPLCSVNCSISTICQVEGGHPAGSSNTSQRKT